MLLVLLGAAILIVFIVSLNIANLLLARASARQQEMAVRLSLGASRGRMVRQLLTESMLLSLIGGAAGIATAVGTLDVILRFVPSSVPRLNEVRIDWVVLAFALLMSMLTGFVFGFVPAFHSATVALSSAMREGGRGSGYSTKTGRFRDVLIVAELAFAIILMIAAGLLSASTASVMASLLYGVRPHDPAVFLIVPLLLFAVAVLASYLPARRATEVDAIRAFREG